MGTTCQSIDVSLISLSKLISSGDLSTGSLRKALHALKCPRDMDVERYLHQYAITNEKNGSSRTYLVIDKRQLDDKKKLRVVAYFTLAITVTDFSGIDEGNRKDYLGFIPKRSAQDYFAGYLLAQIGRSQDYSHEQFDCKELMDEAESRVAEAIDLVGGRVIYLDCKNTPKLISLYEHQGYTVLYIREDGDHPVKMVKVVTT